MPMVRAKDAKASAVGLLGMLAAAKQVLDHGGGVRPDAYGPVVQPLRPPPTDLLMMRRHVRINRTVVTAPSASRVGGDTRASVEDLDCPVRISNVDLLTREAVRYRVIVNVDVDVVIRPHARYLPISILIAL